MDFSSLPFVSVVDCSPREFRLEDGFAEKAVRTVTKMSTEQLQPLHETLQPMDLRNCPELAWMAACISTELYWRREFPED